MPKQVDSEAQRRLIAQAALKVIADSGLDKARLRDVARAAGLTTGAVTHYFDNKEALLEAALEEVVRRTLERMDAADRAGAAPDLQRFVDRVGGFLPIDTASQREWRVWLAYWGRAIHDERLAAVHRGYYQGFINRLARPLRVLGGGQARTLARARKYADALVGALDGVGTRATLDPERWPAKRQRDTLSALLIPLLTEFTTNPGRAHP